MRLRNVWIFGGMLVLMGAKKPTDDTSNPAYKNVAVSTEADHSGKPAKPAGFVHPGVLVNRAQLAEIKKRVAAGKGPQKTAFEALKSNKLGAIDYIPHPRETVECGSNSRPDLGCKDEQADSDAAYAQALLWAITGDEAYAKNAIRIMDAWSSTLKGGHTNANGQVQAGWTGAVFPRAAEIIRYGYGKWPDADIARFQNMLTTQFLPQLIHGTCENGNKELTMAEALVNIGVFNDNRAVFDHGITMWRGRAPAYIYLKTDGPKPVEATGCGIGLWGNKGFTPELVDGLLQETARDSQHANLALSAMVDVAETARQQGIDLYGEQGKRIVAALEFQAQYLAPNNTPAPEKLEFNPHPTWEIAYNEFHDRLGMKLPKMAAVLLAIRPTGTNHHMNWETLTHAEMGGVGLPALKKVKASR
jgi:hypothetical protein